MTNLNLGVKGSTAGEDSEQHYQERIRDLESVNGALKREVEELRSKLADVSISSSVGTLQSTGEFSRNSIAKKEEAMSSRSKSNSLSMCSKKKHKTETPLKQIDGEVQKLKAHKVKLQCKIKLDSMQFRLLKASLEKEILQLKKEQRKSAFEKHVLSTLHRRQKLILQLKNTQVLASLKRQKLLLRSKKISSNKNKGPAKGTSSRIQDSSNEVGKLLNKIHSDYERHMKLNKIHSDYERQMKEIAEEVKKFSVEAGVLKAEFELEQNSCSPSCDNGDKNSPMESLKELKEEFNKLSTMVSQMEMTKSQHSEAEKVQRELVDEYSVSNKKTNHQSKSNSEASQPRTLQEAAPCKKEQSKAEVCCSCSNKSLCKTSKCKCRANGSGCGKSCGCLASKCSNREEMVITDKAIHPKAGGIRKDNKEANKQPLRDIGNIQEAGKVGKLKKVQKPVTKK